jgi:hypothetical protein
VLSLQRLILELLLLSLQRKLRVDLSLFSRDPARNTSHLGFELRRQRLDRRMKSSDLLLRRLNLIVDLGDLGTKVGAHRRTSPLEPGPDGQLRRGAEVVGRHQR